MTTPYSVWHRRQMCTRKQALLSEEQAHNFAWLVEVAHGTPMEPYRCLYCGDWHVAKQQTEPRMITPYEEANR